MDPVPVATPTKIRKPTAADTRPGRSTGNARGAQAELASTMRIPAAIGPPKSAEIAENEPAVASTACSFSGEPHRVDDGEPGGRAERDQRRLGPEHSAERSVPSAASATPGP